MTDQSFDFDFLARETLALTEQLRKKSLKEINEQERMDDFSELSELSEDDVYEMDSFVPSKPATAAKQFELDLFEDAFDFSSDEGAYEQEDLFETASESLESENIQEIEDFEVEDLEVEEALPIQGPGIIYKVEKGISTFCIRGHATDDLAWELDALERQDPQSMKQLRMTEEDSLESVGFFETHDQAFAETVVDQLMNRRFPRQEAIVCNISDPGFSWWLSCDNLSFEVYFQSHGIERDENLIQLGPLGDPFIAYQFFKKSFNFLKTQFSINEFSATEKGLRVSCGARYEKEFQKLVQLFIDGSFPWEQSIFEGGHSKDKGLLLYFYELSLLRSFWVGIQNQLNQ